MVKKNIAKIEKKVKVLQKQMGKLGPVMRGNVVFIGTGNKQFYFSLNKDKKTKLIYLGNKRVKRAKQLSDNYKKLLDIVENMTILNMEILRKSY